MMLVSIVILVINAITECTQFNFMHVLEAGSWSTTGSISRNISYSKEFKTIIIQ